MQTYDAIILKKKVWYLDPAAICEAAHASPKWMPDTNDYLKLFPTKKKNKRHEKNFITRPSQTLWSTYRLWWHDGKTWMSYMLHTTSSKSNIDHFIINHCSDPHLQNVHNIFFLRNHWIAFLIQPKLEKNLVFDSLDWSTKRYEEFLKIIQLWVNFLLSFPCTSCLFL